MLKVFIVCSNEYHRVFLLAEDRGQALDMVSKNIGVEKRHLMIEEQIPADNAVIIDSAYDYPK